ncbi:hypothetical protein Lal_00014845 [Lupinus albus]|nr:hypothetical protein Lal_00014845 [Lupinus albus]
MLLPHTHLTKGDSVYEPEYTSVAARPGAYRPPGLQDRFFLSRHPPGRRHAPAARRRPLPGHGAARHRHDPRAGRRRQCRRPVGPGPGPRHPALRPAHDDEDADLRRAHGHRPAPEEAVVLHDLARRGSHRQRPRARAEGWRHVLSDLPPAKPPDGARVSAGRDDLPAAVQRSGPAEGPPASRDVFREGQGLLHDFRQPRHADPAGRRLGDGVGDQGRHEDRVRLDRRRRDGGKRFPHGAHVRARVPGARDPQRRQQPVGDLHVPGHRRRRERQLRGARRGRGHRLAAGGRQRLPRRLRRVLLGGRAGPLEPRPHADRMGDVPRRPALDVGRPVALPARRRVDLLPAGRPDRAPAPPPDRQGLVVGRGARRPAGRTGSGSAGRAEGGGTARHPDRRARAQCRIDVRGRLQGHARTPAPPTPTTGGVT